MLLLFLQKPNNKKRIIVCVLFFSLLSSVCWAASLEVPSYPATQTGTQITPTTELPEFVKYLYEFGFFIGFASALISLLWAGILYVSAGANPTILQKAKDRVSGAVTGIILLALTYLIITTINPAFQFFKTKKLEEPPPSPPLTSPSAPVILYKKPNCQGDPKKNEVLFLNKSTPSLEDSRFANLVRSVAIDPSYLVILYDHPNFWGRCFVLDPKQKCINVEPFANSVLISKWGGGGYSVLLRKSYFQNKDSYYFLSYEEIKQRQDNTMGAVFSLKELAFEKKPQFDKEEICFPDDSQNEYCDLCTVPPEERDCSFYNTKGECIQRQCPFCTPLSLGQPLPSAKNQLKCPNLEDQNLTSIYTSGYLVLLVYFDSLKDKPLGPWSDCQTYPSYEDVNTIGPGQIKWDPIRNRLEDPNYIIFIPTTTPY